MLLSPASGLCVSMLFENIPYFSQSLLHHIVILCFIVCGHLQTIDFDLISLGWGLVSGLVLKVPSDSCSQPGLGPTQLD